MHSQEETLMDGEDCFSDESSFYGDDATKRHFETLAATYSPSTYRPAEHLNPTLMAARGQHSRRLASEAAAKLWSPGAGQPNHRQLSESAREFVTRIAPTSTAAAQHGWLWVHNPHLGRSHAAHAQIENAERDEVLRSGRQALSRLQEARAALEAAHPGMTAGVATRRLAADRRAAEREIHEAAQACGWTGGKWLLFARAPDVARTWLAVVEATVAGRLGVCAKVGSSSAGSGAADGGGDGGGPGRSGASSAAAWKGEGPRWVVCVYTENFADREDVQRVLEALRENKIIGSRESVSYKSDVLTGLGVYAGNDWKISPVLYTSKDF